MGLLHRRHNPDYGVNLFIGATRRISNTSGTIFAAEYSNPSINSAPDGSGGQSYTAPTVSAGPVNGVSGQNYTYNTFGGAFATSVACRHPALPPVPGTGTGTTGLLNVAFVDGHVDVFTNTSLLPSSGPSGNFASIGDALWNNGGLQRTD